MPGRAQVGWSTWARALLSALRDDARLPEDALQGLLAALQAEPAAGAWHPTGFVVLKLLDDVDGALRLHLWPAGARERGEPCWPVHDHVWDLRSHVLCGQIESHAYVVSDDDAGEAALYAVDYGAGRSSCMRRSERRVSVRGLAPRRIGAGERYEVPAGAFHASHVDANELAATLVVTRPTAQPWPWVVGALDAASIVRVERALASHELVSEMLRRLAMALGVASRCW